MAMEQLVARIDQLTAALNNMAERNNQQEAQIEDLHRRLNNNNNNDALLKIPDPVKSIQTYDGNKKQLASWLRTVEITLNRYQDLVNEDTMGIYLMSVVNKLEGKARGVISLAGEIGNFDQLKEILNDALGDRQELSTYKCQLWHNKMQEDTSIYEYYTTTKTIVQNIKTLTKQKALYANHWDAVNAMIEEDAIAAFISGLRKPYFGYVQAANPTNIEEAYAFLCKFNSREKNSNNMKQREQMEVDPLLASRATFSKNLFNNSQEMEEKKEESTDDEQDELDFLSVDPEKEGT